MFDTLLSADWVPFTTAFALLLGLLTLELVGLLLGFSLLGEVEGDVDLPDLDGLEVELPEGAGDYAIPDMAEVDAVDAGITSWTGIGRTPFMIWLGSVLLGFGTAGYLIQAAAEALSGTAFPWILASFPAAIAAFWFAGRFGKVFAAVLPKTESTSISERRYAGHKGVISQGTASHGRPAEVRMTDRFGNIHHLRAEPLEDAQLTEGTEVLILRNRHTGEFRITALTR
ncbi:MAG: OB-fold-containig protein [Shimia sp.]